MLTRFTAKRKGWSLVGLILPLVLSLHLLNHVLNHHLNHLKGYNPPGVLQFITGSQPPLEKGDTLLRSLHLVVTETAVQDSAPALAMIRSTAKRKGLMLSLHLLNRLSNRPLKHVKGYNAPGVLLRFTTPMTSS
jgi:hypothetical protein